MTAQFIFALLLLLLAAACASRSKPVSPPVAPPVQAEKPRVEHIKPRPGDTVIRGCIVTRVNKTTADCICRQPANYADVVSGDFTLNCKSGTPAKKKGKTK